MNAPGLPPLERLSLGPGCRRCAPTGDRVPPGAEPEKTDRCGVCLESLTEHIGSSQLPGEALRPAPPAWVRICASHHAYHKLCIREWLVQSTANRLCPECKQPVLLVDELRKIPDGSGSKWYAGGELYDGQWQGGKPSGQGTVRYPNGSRYTGQWENGLRHGRGTWRNALYDYTYEGEWENNERSGLGTQTWGHGGSYVGTWQHDKRHGQGVNTYARGAKYNGQWENDRWSGQGTWKDGSGRTYTGTFKIDDPHFQGTVRYPNGDVYVGTASMVKGRTGDGTLTSPDGTVYVGEWQNDKFHGRGTLSSPDGTVVTGEWKDGVRV